MFSSEKIAYFDYNATAALLPGLSERMIKASQKHFGNPSSPHRIGRNAKDILEESRIRIARSIGIQAQELIFTSGGSEGNNAVLRQLLFRSGPQHIITSQIEHPSVLETCRILEQCSPINISYLPVDRSGRVRPESLSAAIRPETSLISIMMANNETGVIQPIESLASIADEHKIPLHVDCVQGLGKIPMHWMKWNVSYATVSAHKFGGPRGIGLLFLKEGVPFNELISGGKQERIRRAGTENVMLACGFAEALDWININQESTSSRLLSFKNRIIEELKSIDGFFLIGEHAPCLPNTINFGLSGISAESLLIRLDLDHVAVSTGSACSSGALEASHVLLAMGLEKSKAKSCLRLSMGWNTNEEEVEYLIDRIHLHAQKLYEKQRCGNK
ncbi:MAG: cysteine desulfurase [SAR324 cluster bacterium]|nr:cysteine desulfurase [SAR324 cluster bacterium]